MALVKNPSDITNSTIGENSYFSGRFFINGSLKIDGKFEGQSLQAEQLYIGVNGRVKTNVQASAVIVEGIIIGNIVARSRVMLLPSAKVLGDITTPELIIQNGVILEGKCIITTDAKHSTSGLIEQEYGKDNMSMDRLFSTRKSAK